MNFDHDPKDPEPQPSHWRGTRVAALIGGLVLTLLFWMTCPQKAAAQDLLSDLALLGIRAASGTLAPRCSIEREPPSTNAHRSPPPIQDMNVQVYPPPPPPRSMNVRVWPEPARKPVGDRGRTSATAQESLIIAQNGHRARA